MNTSPSSSSSPTFSSQTPSPIHISNQDDMVYAMLEALNVSSEKMTAENRATTEVEKEEYSEIDDSESAQNKKQKKKAKLFSGNHPDLNAHENFKTFFVMKLFFLVRRWCYFVAIIVAAFFIVNTILAFETKNGYLLSSLNLSNTVSFIDSIKEIIYLLAIGLSGNLVALIGFGVRHYFPSKKVHQLEKHYIVSKGASVEPIDRG